MTQPTPKEIADHFIDRLAEATELVDLQIIQLGKAADVQEPSARVAGVNKEASILGARVARETLALQGMYIRQLLNRLESLEHVTATSAAKVEASIDRFSAATDRGGVGMQRWTKVMAWATVALVIVAVLQIGVALIGILNPPQIIVIGRP